MKILVVISIVCAFALFAQYTSQEAQSERSLAPFKQRVAAFEREQREEQQAHFIAEQYRRSPEYQLKRMADDLEDIKDRLAK
jgi:hypothetical protein